MAYQTSPGPYSVELFASDLASVLDNAGWDTAIIGGASMGGCVALTFANMYAERTVGLGLIDTTAWYGETSIADWEERGQKAITTGMNAMTGFQKTRWFSDNFRAENENIIEHAVEVFVANDPNAYLETCRMLASATKATRSRTFLCHVKLLLAKKITPHRLQWLRACIRLLWDRI